ncbi:NTP pyrophosphohydrolase including oxidative damage repair enzymes [Streptococcus pneumoniae]|nr:NTP pyrophosphohydrolase including oxidative damage repair enzymes [Streptococcus pneumoniae]VKR36556.1 NTP pyrophosphohydrolase including oxidative damage repair enzymes [Streptococcus pneumoniae]VLN36660.1 NTP pyrophosphohydrolase including oxidative damage repair enzymes [Streptococcus pneumoniae]VNE83952.1 NTP pyrophosphohydrolase including oxidative damage repair enzymes [Streptococcus pneumoniae]VQR13570.1 NTP pyrophosphohydrolase including oxidative damage repair enzymes [Streptococcu
MEIKNHFGVYCVCFENGKLLCIEKTRGPYQHRKNERSLSTSKKREVLINIGMIYLEAVSNLVKD